jgi:hypothetical protein
VFWLVTLPMMARSLVSAWLLTFTLSLDDVVLSAFLSGPGSTTMPLVIFSRARLGLNPSVNAVATVIVVIVVHRRGRGQLLDRPRRTPAPARDGRRQPRLRPAQPDSRTSQGTPMKLHAPTALVLALATAFPALAQSNAELLKELQALRDRVTQLEQKLQQQPQPQLRPGPVGHDARAGARAQPRAVKAEALQDNFADQGFKGLKISGQMDPTWIYNKRQDDSTFVFLNNGGARYTYDNSYFGMAVLDFEKETESGTKWKLTLAPERGTGSLINGGSIVHEASVSIPLGDLQTRLWLGQIPDWTGYELHCCPGNKLITHNLLFDFMAPTAYTGAVLDVTSGKWWVRAGLANFNTAAQHAGQQGAGAHLPGRLLQGRVRRLRLQRPARQGAQLRRRRHLGRHRHDADGKILEEILCRRRQEHRHPPAGVRRLLHPRRLVAVRPGQLRPAEGIRHLQQRRPAARRALVGPVGHRGLQSRRAWKACCAPTTSTTPRTAAACWATASTTASTASAAAAGRRQLCQGRRHRQPTATR